MDNSTFSSLDDQIISEALSPNTCVQTQDGGKDRYIWGELDSCWEKLVGSKEDSNSHFEVKNCEGDGNCQFRSIQEAIKGSSLKFTHRKLRGLVADFILRKLSDPDFKLLLDNYKIEKNNGDFIGEWNPFSVKTKRQFIKQVKKPGFHFEGDDTTLSLLSKALKADFVIFNQTVNNTNITELSHDHDIIIILLFTNSGNHSGHYQTVGVKHNNLKKVQTLFNRKKLPDIVEKLLNQDYFYQTQIEKYQSANETTFTLTGLYRYLNVTFKRTITRDDKLIISRILKEVLRTMKAKYHPPKGEKPRPKKSIKKSVKKSPSQKKSIKKSVQKKSIKKSVSKSRSQQKSVKKSVRKSRSHKRSQKKSVRRSVRKSRSHKQTRQRVKRPFKK